MAADLHLLRTEEVMHDIALIIGSLRKESNTRRLALAVRDLAVSSLRIEDVPIGDLRLYNQDLESAPPREWVAFRDRISRADGVLFATPEYNRSVPGGLKNALDVGSRPYGKSRWAGKPAAVLSATSGGLGGFGANHHLRQSLVFLDMPAMQQPEAYISSSATLFDDGQLKADLRTFMQSFIDAFARWVDRFASARAHDSAA